ncbi:hypothetical protein SYNPS1DRAFT_27769 [Syncephalis pseudoplumigaleata]|uniref:Uncharacterized protein n=1 Tax=Syncephalis pseudoplumigaleata TaxID=1712513 RepID=A0A4P9Z2G6_9FUNG|nr:hypothetical protein SYNPS1DRAFT_27769 [Syncephalis pseudoplumigaleata]|eukprot:RKP26548.1 hypothetical protein SYNPS1DRAFT_27769 [Syncephalis pseudoplumigaleata]
MFETSGRYMCAIVMVRYHDWSRLDTAYMVAGNALFGPSDLVLKPRPGFVAQALRHKADIGGLAAVGRPQLHVDVEQPALEVLVWPAMLVTVIFLAIYIDLLQCAHNLPALFWVNLVHCSWMRCHNSCILNDNEASR